LEKVALIVAGGKGARMNSKVPKQFLLLKGLPVLMHTIRAFYRYNDGMRIILVLPVDQIQAWQDLCVRHQFTVRHEVGMGGETRFHSVKNNLAVIPDHCLVAVHDGVRPLVSQETLERCFMSALQYGNAVPCIEIPETLRYLDGEQSHQVDRSKFRLIQTPQVFESSILKEAYRQEYQPDFTDDAGVVESLGFTIKLVEGNPENIKITWHKDLSIATTYLRSGNG
jgi:2-C-methyl-D-erythritol 4-phosphate cytidylyltransferase